MILSNRAILSSVATVPAPLFSFQPTWLYIYEGKGTLDKETFPLPIYARTRARVQEWSLARVSIGRPAK